jgi:transposase InsO family protein
MTIFFSSEGSLKSREPAISSAAPAQTSGNGYQSGLEHGFCRGCAVRWQTPTRTDRRGQLYERESSHGGGPEPEGRRCREHPQWHRNQAGLPATIKVDNGSEFISKVTDKRSYERRIELDFSRPGKPTDNAKVESFNGRLRQKCLNARWFCL